MGAYTKLSKGGGDCGGGSMMMLMSNRRTMVMCCALAVVGFILVFMLALPRDATDDSHHSPLAKLATEEQGRSLSEIRREDAKDEEILVQREEQSNQQKQKQKTSLGWLERLYHPDSQESMQQQRDSPPPSPPPALQKPPVKMTAIGEHRTQKMDSYLAQRKEQCDIAGKWVSVDMAKEDILFSNVFYRDELSEPKDFLREERDMKLSRCEIEDEDGQGGWYVNRFGPFVGEGGHDNHDLKLIPLPHPEKAKFITGKMAAPVDPSGNILGYPPIHTHHIMYGFSGVFHALESHGDAVCSEEYGGEACYLISYPDGYGLPLVNETDNKDRFFMTLLFNDVRAYPSPPMEFYGEIAFKWSSRDSVRPISAAALQMNGKSHTFQSNVVSQRPNIRWGTAKWVEDGKVIISPEDQLPWFHSHRSYFKSMWAFAASAEELGLTADLLHPVDDYDQGGLDEYDLVWTPDGEDATQALMNRVRSSPAGMDALRCWLIGSEEEKILEHVNATTESSALYSEPWQQNWKESWYDRAGEVHCDPWSFKKGDNYTIVTLNGVDDRLSDKLDHFTWLQHGILFIAYESTGPEMGPTLEIYGNFDMDDGMTLKMKTTFLPEYLQKRKDYYKKEITNSDLGFYYDVDLDVVNTHIIRVGYNFTIERTLSSEHTFFDAAKKKLEK